MMNNADMPSNTQRKNNCRKMQVMEKKHNKMHFPAVVFSLLLTVPSPRCKASGQESCGMMQSVHQALLCIQQGIFKMLLH